MLKQAKAKLTADRKKLNDELRHEREGRERAEGLLREFEKKLAAANARAARAEEGRTSALAELRWAMIVVGLLHGARLFAISWSHHTVSAGRRSVTGEYQQAEDTIQQLLRQLIAVKERAASVAPAGNAGRVASQGGGRMQQEEGVATGDEQVRGHSC